MAVSMIAVCDSWWWVYFGFS